MEMYSLFAWILLFSIIFFIFIYAFICINSLLFLLLISITWNEYIIICPSVDGYFEFPVWANMKKYHCYEKICTWFFVDVSSFLFSKYLERKLLCQRVGECWTFKKLPNYFPRRLYYRFSHQRCKSIPVAPHLHKHLALPVLLTLAMILGETWNLMALHVFALGPFCTYILWWNDCSSFYFDFDYLLGCLSEICRISIVFRQ